MKKLTSWQLVSGLLLIVLFIPKPTQAYIDPSTGSSFFQAFIAIAVTGGFVIKSYWRQIIRFIKKQASKQAVASEDQKPPEQQL
jgi:hypothetical protein